MYLVNQRSINAESLRMDYEKNVYSYILCFRNNENNKNSKKLDRTATIDTLGISDIKD